MPEEFITSLRQCLHHLYGAARNLPWLSLLSLAVLAGALPLLMSCGDKKHDKPLPPRPVRYALIGTPTSAPAGGRTGEIRAHDETALSFRLDGRMVTRAVDVGYRVKAGQILATLESMTAKNQLDSAAADLEGAKASTQVAALNLSRMQKLMPSGAIARTQVDSARADWLSANARLKSSEAALRNARENLTWTQLVSSTDGVITGVSASVGQVLSAGQTVLTVATGDMRDVVFDIADPEQLSSEKSSVLTVMLLSNPSICTTGVLRDISPQADPQTRTWRVRVTLQDPPAAMALGASVTVALPAAAAPGYLLPASALSRVGEKPAVFIIDSHMQAQLRPVTLAGYTASSLIIASGLQTGDKVITSGVGKLRAGEDVIAGEQRP